MSASNHRCPTCQDTLDTPVDFERRRFLKTAGVAASAAAAAGWCRPARAEQATKPAPETSVKHLYDSLSDEQKKVVCFDWDHTEKERGLLRTRVANNWHITKPSINDEFFTAEQRKTIRDIFEGMIQPEWHAKIDQQLKDDAGGFGQRQNIAIFGQPGTDQFEFVMTGRHMTLRCDGNSTEHVAFGGPIFYGHAAQGFYEKADHPGNVFWEQALAANQVYEMLDGKQREKASVAKSPRESAVQFRGPQGEFSGIPIAELSDDQKELTQKVLQKLIEPYRQTDRDEVVNCLKAQGGLDKCSLAFYTDNDIGADGVWDNWRLEGPSFVWYFRGSPHVHVWVHVADDPSVELNA